MDILTDHWIRILWWLVPILGTSAEVFSPESLFNFPDPPTVSKPNLRPSSQPSRGNDLARCEQLLQERPDDYLGIMRQEGLISELEDVSFRRTLFSTIIIGTGSVHFGCAPRQDKTNCTRNACYNLRYRTMDGSCNNFIHPFLGAAATPYVRYHPANYDDGVAAVTATLTNSRPSARDITKNVLSNGISPTHPTYNSMLMQFGQFIAHDISKTAMLSRSKCETCTQLQSHCAPIPILGQDPAYACPRLPCCLLFTRASPVCGTGFNKVARQQLNENTAFIDGSAVYGSSVPDRDRLRDGIFMKTTFFNETGYLPFDKTACTGPTDCNVTFDAGDSRFVIFIGLAAFHTMMLREHNRLAEKLGQMNPHWSADRVFEEARKILGAELQAITYREWLPKILGQTAYDHYIGPYNGYKPEVDASIASEFTYAAMRFGHGMIVEQYDRLNGSNQPIPEGTMKFEEGVLRPHKLLFEGGIEALLRGMVHSPVKRPQRISPMVTTRLFGSQDLASISLQRGRDAGISSYNDMREFCGLGKALTFEELENDIKDDRVRNNLRDGFGSPDAMDLYVGGLVEDPVAGAMVGPTIACILGDQFKRIRDGDRFWYENPNTFLHKQLVELDKSSMARLMCDNMLDFHSVPRDGFELPTTTNVENCKNIPSMDLEKWLD